MFTLLIIDYIFGNIVSEQRMLLKRNLRSSAMKLIKSVLLPWEGAVYLGTTRSDLHINMRSNL